MHSTSGPSSKLDQVRRRLEQEASAVSVAEEELQRAQIPQRRISLRAKRLLTFSLLAAAGLVAAGSIFLTVRHYVRPTFPVYAPPPKSRQEAQQPGKTVKDLREEHTQRQASPSVKP